ncbi:MAG TPA: glycosyltransferase family 4 protein [Candidatus Eisenbacteria bacterium]|nr:glycosyltransferase family 4 protein [Candidatus Eisenbacteria bacterium]
MEPLRIAVLLPHLGVYGGIRRFLELGSVWSRRGHRVALLVPPDRAGESPWLPFPGEIGALDRLRAAAAWDVVISPDPDLFLGALEPAAPGRPLHVFYAVLERAPRARDAWGRADLVLANSSGMLRHLERRGVAAAAGVPGGVNTSFFTPPDPDPRLDPARPAGLVRFLVYGRLSRRRKGSETAVRAIARACRSARVDAHVTLFDSPPKGADTPSLAAPSGITLRWVLHPTQESLRDLYREADLFVSAERRAGWCNTAAEAMACGAAVVCTRSGTEDFAMDGETAAVSRWPWAWALARRIRPLLDNPEARTRLSSAGHRAIQEFSWERTADRVEAAIRDALRRRERG